MKCQVMCLVILKILNVEVSFCIFIELFSCLFNNSVNNSAFLNSSTKQSHKKIQW